MQSDPAAGKTAYPTISSVPDWTDRFTGRGAKAAGKLEEGDTLLSVQAATAQESMTTACALGKKGNAAIATSRFLASALGPVTLEVERLVDKKARRASVAALAAKRTDLHESDGHTATISTIAAADVDTGGDGVVGEAKVLEKVGLAPQQLKIVYSRKRGSQH